MQGSVSSSEPAATQMSLSVFPTFNMKFKTNLCTNFMQTQMCQRGPRCHFAHGEEELRKEDEPLPMWYVDEVQKQQLNYYTTPYCNYKTVKCKLHDQGYCKFGQNCKFAHGDVELRNPHDPLLLEAGDNQTANMVYLNAYISQPPPSTTMAVIEKMPVFGEDPRVEGVAQQQPVAAAVSQQQPQKCSPSMPMPLDDNCLALSTSASNSVTPQKSAPSFQGASTDSSVASPRQDCYLQQIYSDFLQRKEQEPALVQRKQVDLTNDPTRIRLTNRCNQRARENLELAHKLFKNGEGYSALLLVEELLTKGDVQFSFPKEWLRQGK